MLRTARGDGAATIVFRRESQGCGYDCIDPDGLALLIVVTLLWSPERTPPATLASTDNERAVQEDDTICGYGLLTPDSGWVTTVFTKPVRAVVHLLVPARGIEPPTY